MLIFCLSISVDIMIVIIAVCNDLKHIMMKLTHDEIYFDVKCY